MTDLDPVRYELLPFGAPEREASLVGGHRTLTMTCSPRHGIDHGVEVAAGLRALGHDVVAHLAARQVEGPEHLDRLLEALAAAGIVEVFLIGGDVRQPAGPYASSLDLLPALRAHRSSPRTIGVAAYPEGHPLVDDATLTSVLREKAAVADYCTTQMCFDGGAVVRWLERTRDAGIELPVLIGLPGAVDRRRLLEVSLRVGVGASVSFLRKQRGIGRLASRSASAESLHVQLAPLVGGDLGVAGLHFFTFNRLCESVRLAEGRHHSDDPIHRSAGSEAISGV